MKNINIQTSKDSFTHLYNADRKHKGIQALIYDIPVVVYQMGIEKARLEGDPDYMNYWDRNDNANAKAYMARQRGFRS
jgi:hypothetical protein